DVRPRRVPLAIARLSSAAAERSKPSQPSVPCVLPPSTKANVIPSRDGGSPSIFVTLTSAARAPAASASRTASVGSMEAIVEEGPRRFGGVPRQVPDDEAATSLAEVPAEERRVDALREVQGE